MKHLAIVFAILCLSASQVHAETTVKPAFTNAQTTVVVSASVAPTASDVRPAFQPTILTSARLMSHRTVRPVNLPSAAQTPSVAIVVKAS